MIDFEYAAQNMRGVWRMAFGGPDWRDDVDTSENGVFKSLAAIALATPFMLLAYVAAHRAVIKTGSTSVPHLSETPLFVLLPAELVGFYIGWAACIAALIFTAHLIGARKAAAPAIVSFNWAHLITTIVSTVPPTVFGVSANIQLTTILYSIAAIFTIIVLWRVLRISLPINAGMTIALIALLLLAALVSSSLVTSGAVFLYQLFS